jgi:hypothetical protein
MGARSGWNRKRERGLISGSPFLIEGGNQEGAMKAADPADPTVILLVRNNRADRTLTRFEYVTDRSFPPIIP